MLALEELLKRVITRLDREAGATMVEYGLLIALIAIVVAVAALTLGESVSSLYAKVAGLLP